MCRWARIDRTPSGRQQRVQFLAVVPKKLLLAFVGLCPAISGLAEGQLHKPPESPTLFVQCDYPSRPAKNLVATSLEFVAPNTGYRAWVQVTSATASNSDAACYNTVVVWISKGRDQFFQPLYTHVPVQSYLEGNGMGLVDWSPNGQLLLAELWQWNTEPRDAPFDKRVLVFQPKTKRKFEINLDRLLTKQKGKNCFVEFQLRGFTTDNWVVLKTHVSTWYDDGDTLADVPANRRCRETTQTWAIEPASQKWRLLPANFLPIHYSSN